MKSMFLLFSATLLSSGLTYQVNEKEAPVPPKLPLRPGDLLKRLDALTSDAQVIYSPLQTTPTNLAERRVYHDESLHDNEESGSEYDYDKAYENFVNKYFAEGEEDLDSEDHDDDGGDYDEKADDASPFEFSGEADDDDDDDKSKEKEKSSSAESKKCERVKIDNQNCKVCEDPKTNEKSRICSYSSDDKPKSYGYSKQRSTKHSKDGEDDDGSSESGRSLKRETSQNNKKKFQPRLTNIEPFLKSSEDDPSQCTRKLEDGMICFYCGSNLNNTRECLVDKNNLKKRRLEESSKKDSATKKVFKRMVSYSFKNDDKPKFKENTYAAFQGYSA